MDKKEFSAARARLGKSQREFARVLGVSLKAVESYEQGWRGIPPAVERLTYFLLFKSRPDAYADGPPCWETKSCDEETKNKCIAFEAREGHFCWFFTGGLCASAKESGKGEGYCHDCEVFLRMKSLTETQYSARP